ncbi:DUF5667 domain-containing protein [Nocardioides marmotae]|uniref:DUF5667 domain-containing protein n=1 Tax=Nocardioides marmotae TaxID=2663857 RepID=A0A6I3J730_9ACTN|nr:DUF5667 domain-containing protein [Nocardioides marmotae]MCR6029999.1 hypothetical protein [Gordonia jinghuaiqii]MBC9732955.1 hypothetical protein [Nocardioides marmotae]MTB84069.1 hypothetical protein [Nocardioides marmotae]MTB93629.1 hypothetical protein [Nocardioides marmotae]QKD99986.1 hypothetical protein HPC71_01965 [Nocardioides marmotae]
MSPVFAARRRAEEFDSLLEGTATRELHDARTVELVELVGALRSTPPAEARPAFVADLRERLMAEAATALVPAPARARDEIESRLTVAPRRTARDRRIAAAVGGLAIVGATTSMAVAAQTSLPGDTLYPLKRAIENAQTGFSVSDNQKGSHLLANAQGRLREVEQLSQSDEARESATETTIATTLVEFTDQASAASELLIKDYEENGHAAAITELRDFTGDSMDALAGLESLLPDGARPALIQAAQLLTQIDAEAAALCTVCGGEGISVIPPFAVQAVEDVLGGLVGALTPPIQAAGPGEGRGSGKGPGKGEGRTSDVRPGQGTGGQSAPTDIPTLPPTTDGPGQGTSPSPAGQPSTIGGVLGNLLGGGGNGGSNGGGANTSTPTTLPEVIDDVLGGVGDLVDSILQPPKGTKTP